MLGYWRDVPDYWRDVLGYRRGVPDYSAGSKISRTTVVWEWTGEGEHDVVDEQLGYASPICRETGDTFRRRFGVRVSEVHLLGAGGRRDEGRRRRRGLAGAGRTLRWSSEEAVACSASRSSRRSPPGSGSAQRARDDRKSAGEPLPGYRAKLAYSRIINASWAQYSTFYTKCYSSFVNIGYIDIERR
ncbi:MAG: hypothetical protein ABEJ05_10060 [Haloglomus sp.]